MSLITTVDILDEAKECFLTYSEEVLTDRAIPAAEDGLLSAQRKILWTMADYLGMDAKSKTKKSNAVVGSTLSTSYFHGDASCYGVLRKMSLEFLMRYPLIIGQGQLGTQEDNDMYSSSRYTEVKPSIFTDLMMNNYKKQVVPTKETYNGEYMEPVVLPSLFPNALCNGKQAIGVSMAHSSLPNNLTEVCNAAIALISKGTLSLEEVLEYIPGPDFPLGGTVLNTKDVREAYRTGKSNVSLKVQGDYEIQGDKIIFTSIPYRTYRNKIKEQIEKNIDALSELIDDFDDESNIGYNRLVFHVKSGIEPKKALNSLFLLTDLQASVSYNLNYIVDGTPKLCSMVELLRAYVKHQENVLIKATQYDKDKAVARAHILRGLIAAVDKIDEIISIIKTSSNKQEAKDKIMALLKVDVIQANAILDMKLGRLTRIDKLELTQELKDKVEFIERCDAILNKQEVRNQKLIELITSLRDTYGDARRTKLTNQDIPKKVKEPVIVESKECTVIINEQNMVKRVDKAQKRAKGKSEKIKFLCQTHTQDTLIIITSKGKAYRVLVENIPEGTNNSRGVSLSSIVTLESNEEPLMYAMLEQDIEKSFMLLVTQQGLIKLSEANDFKQIKRSGTNVIKLRDNDKLTHVSFVDREEIMIFTKQGMAIRFNLQEVTPTSRAAQGVKGITLKSEDEVLTAIEVKDYKDIAVISKDNIIKRMPISDFPVQKRAGKGLSSYKGDIINAFAVNETTEIMIVGDSHTETVKVHDIKRVTRIDVGIPATSNNNKILQAIKV